MSVIELALELHRANLRSLYQEHSERLARADELAPAILSLERVIEKLERELMPDSAVDLQADGEPCNPNAGTVQAYPNGRY